MVTWYNTIGYFLAARSIHSITREEISWERKGQLMVYMMEGELLSEVTATLIVPLISQLQSGELRINHAH